MNGGVFSKRLALVLLAASFLVTSLRAQDEEFPTGPEAGRQLAARLLTIKPDESASWRGVLRIFGRGHRISPVPISCDVALSQTNWTVTYMTAPLDTNLSEKFTIIFSTNGPNKYFYARAATPGQAPGAERELSPADADIPLGGSDFWLTDFGLEFLHWPGQNRLKGDIHNGRGRYVLISTNPHPAPGGYSRVKTWIDKESGEPTEADAYGAANTNKIVKSFSLEKIAKVDGRYQAKEMDINGEGKNWTRLEIDVENGKPKN
jgi:hypothetical protein